jgi:alpha-glucosidase/alpha-D-xyloside xylohydrolase
VLLAFSTLPLISALQAQKSSDLPRIIERDHRVIVIEPYAPNIVRITLSTDKATALTAPGYGIIARPSGSGWTQEDTATGGSVFRSSRLSIQLAAEKQSIPRAMPLDALNQKLRGQYFHAEPKPEDSPKTEWVPDTFHDSLTVSTSNGVQLLKMWRWSMAKNTLTPRIKDAGYHLSATFDSPGNEHYYGLGQQQQGFLDLRDHTINCWHDYNAMGGENVCIPFLLSSQGYGIIWDNPSKTTFDLGLNQQNQISSEIGDRISFFVIAGNSYDEIYSGYRQLTGEAHLLPKAAYGYIQSKAIYPTQSELLDVAHGYRSRNLPLDILVVDFLNMTRQGEMDLDLRRWPDAAAMNRELNQMGITTLLSVWPHYSEGTQFYEMLNQKGWLIRNHDGKPDRGGYTREVGPNIDTTNPEAAHWWWAQIRDRYIRPYGFSYIWLDETEPDVDPANDNFSVGSGSRYYNIYPLLHTASVYDGFRQDYGDSRRVFSLARASYLGAQRNGTVFWSSDIVATWDMLKRSIPAGLNFTASGMPNWDTDIAGFFSPTLPGDYHAAHKPLIDPAPAQSNVGIYEDYPELFVRWFEWGAFQPVMRAHGERMHNEVWSYGPQAETILSKYLRLRYQLLPYIYASAYNSYQTGAPFMRALFMDFSKDPKVADIRDEYMFGASILVAPVTEQGATSRSVYLPAGSDWYNYWTGERLTGGRTIEVASPIETIPLFVRAGSILPLGSAILSTQQKQSIETLRVYPGADADFTFLNDDGVSYGYETHASTAHLHWNDHQQQLIPIDAEAKPILGNAKIEIIH